MQITGYSASVHDRFSSGYPAAPVANSNSGFLGKDYDWSGIGWSAADPMKSFGFVSPDHYLIARHYGGAPTIRVRGKTGTLFSGIEAFGENTEYGVSVPNPDLAIGTLQESIPPSAGMFRYGVLDLHGSSTSDTPASYTARPVLVYGHGGNGFVSPRIAQAAVISPGYQQFLTSQSLTTLVTGDSGSPAFIPWTNPNGGKELTIAGNHAAVGSGYNYHSFLGSSMVMAPLNTFMNDDGRALRVVGDPARTWLGGDGTPAQQDDVVRSANWSPATTPSDVFVLFNAALTGFRTADINSPSNLRGVYFKSTAASGDGFTLQGASILTIGRGGVTNYDADRQTVSAPLKLGVSQFWDAGPGGVTLANLNTNGKLLEIAGGAAEVCITGAISGSGGIALTGGRLVLSGNSSHTGPTWVHHGRLVVTGSIASSEVYLGPEAVLSGGGAVKTVFGPGTVEPGSSAGIFTVDSINPSSGLSYNFEFTAASSPAYGNATASLNDVQRARSATPFVSPLSPVNRVNIFLNAGPIGDGQILKGGFFTDQSADFLSTIQNATVQYYLADPAGPVTYNGVAYRLYDGFLAFQLATAAETAGFADGTVNGRVMQIQTSLPPIAYANWMAKTFLQGTPEADQSPDADPDSDGVNNLMSYALLHALGRRELPAPQPAPDNSGLIFRYRRNRAAADLVYEVWTSEDLSAWTLYAGEHVVSDANPDGDGVAEIIEATIPMAPGAPQKFVQLRVRKLP